MSNCSKWTLACTVPITFACLGGACIAQAHTFPYPEDQEFKVEQAASEFVAARAAAAGAGVSSGAIGAADSVYSAFLTWPQGAKGAVVNVCFWNGTALTQQAVIDSDKVWQGFTSLSLNYTAPTGKIRICNSARDADVRIALIATDPKLTAEYDASRPSGGFWSAVGRQSNFAPPGQASGARYKVTVNLPNIESYRSVGDWDNFNFLVRHELGHARGLLHEHQRAECSGWFDIDAIAASQGWTHDYAAQAVKSFAQLPDSDFYKPSYVGGYDILSIMQYNFDKSWYKEIPGQTNPCERVATVTDPSPGDKATLLAMYPPTAPVLAAIPPPPGGSIQASPGPAVPQASLASRQKVFLTTLANERAILSLLNSPSVLKESLSQLKQVPDIDNVLKRLPPTPKTSAAAIDAANRLAAAVQSLVQLSGAH